MLRTESRPSAAKLAASSGPNGRDPARMASQAAGNPRPRQAARPEVWLVVEQVPDQPGDPPPGGPCARDGHDRRAAALPPEHHGHSPPCPCHEPRRRPAERGPQRRCCTARQTEGDGQCQSQRQHHPAGPGRTLIPVRPSGVPRARPTAPGLPGEAPRARRRTAAGRGRGPAPGASTSRPSAAGS